MSRQEFSKKTKLAAWSRCQGKCDSCGNKIITGAQYDHRIACALGGDNDVSNCDVLCRGCHSLKTTREDVPAIAKSRRIRTKAAGISNRKRKIPGSKGTGLRKKMDGTVIKVDE